MNQLQEVLDLSRARWSDMPQQQGIVIQVRTELAPDLPALPGRGQPPRHPLHPLRPRPGRHPPPGGLGAR